MYYPGTERACTLPRKISHGLHVIFDELLLFWAAVVLRIGIGPCLNHPLLALQEGECALLQPQPTRAPRRQERH